MLHGSADARLRLICLGHHLPLMPCRCGRHLGTHLQMPAQVSSAKGARTIHSELVLPDECIREVQGVGAQNARSSSGTHRAPPPPKRFRRPCRDVVVNIVVLHAQ